MNKVVADASFCGAWIFADEASAAAEELLEDLMSGSLQLVVPALWHYEMANMLRSGYIRGRLSKSGLRAAERALSRVPVQEMDILDQAGFRRLLDLAIKYKLSAYDAAYLELAERLKVPLRTTDKVLGKAQTAMNK